MPQCPGARDRPRRMMPEARVREWCKVLTGGRRGNSLMRCPHRFFTLPAYPPHMSPQTRRRPPCRPLPHETIDVRAQIDALIDQLPPIALLRLWRLLITWTALRPPNRVKIPFTKLG